MLDFNEISTKEELSEWIIEAGDDSQEIAELHAENEQLKTALETALEELKECYKETGLLRISEKIIEIEEVFVAKIQFFLTING